MKILFFVHQFYPECNTGAEKIVLSLAKMMQRYGHRVKVFTYSFHPPSFYDRGLGDIAIKEFVHEGVPVLAFRCRNTSSDIDFSFENPDLSEIAAELIRRERADILHVTYSPRVGELIKSAKQLATPYIVTLTDFFMICPKETLLRSNGAICTGPESGRACIEYCPELSVEKIRKRLTVAREVLSHAKVIVAPSIFAAEMFQKEFKDLEIKVIRYGLPLPAPIADARGYSRGDSVVFCLAGPLESHNGTSTLIEAFMSVTSPTASLKIYATRGAPEPVAMLRDAARQDSRIEFCGDYVPERFTEILQTIDVLVMPSLSHQFPLVVSEALASNVPVITSDVGGTIEIIQDDMNGFVFKMGDAGHLARVIQKVVDTPEVLNRIKANISRMVFSTTEQEAYTYQRIYNQVCVA
jgi:glycosyltransferase involved in cell wall biosynthesis